MQATRAGVSAVSAGKSASVFSGPGGQDGGQFRQGRENVGEDICAMDSGPFKVEAFGRLARAETRRPQSAARNGPGPDHEAPICSE